MPKALQPLQSWKQLLSIQVGGAICLPVIMVGHLLCEKYGCFPSLLIIGVGNALLLLLGLVAVHMSVSHRESTVEQAKRYFGERGVHLFAMTLMCAMLGWFAIQLNVMSLSLNALLQFFEMPSSPIFMNVVLGTALSGLMLKGIRAVSWLADLSMPLLILTLGYALWSVEFSLQEERLPSLSLWSGLAIILSVELAAVIDLPTFFQYAKAPRDGYIGIVLLYGLVVPLIEGVGVYLSCQDQAKTILDILHFGQNTWWTIWAALFILLAGWTTNNANLYSAVVNSQRLFPSLSFEARVTLLGFVGTFIACLNPVEHLELTLNVLGIAIGSMGAVLLSSHLWEMGREKGMNQRGCLLAWIAGVSVGCLSLLQIGGMTSIAFVDAFVTALMVNLVFLSNHFVKTLLIVK